MVRSEAAGFKPWFPWGRGGVLRAILRGDGFPEMGAGQGRARSSVCPCALVSAGWGGACWAPAECR